MLPDISLKSLALLQREKSIEIAVSQLQSMSPEEKKGIDWTLRVNNGVVESREAESVSVTQKPVIPCVDQRDNPHRQRVILKTVTTKNDFFTGYQLRTYPFVSKDTFDVYKTPDGYVFEGRLAVPFSYDSLSKNFSDKEIVSYQNIRKCKMSLEEVCRCINTFAAYKFIKPEMSIQRC